MKRFFHSDLETIRSCLVLMGQRSIEVSRLAVRGLVENDSSLLEKVLEEDDEIDRLDVQIDTDSVKYISLRSPVASDVRLLTVAMKAAHDLERCGDEACSIAKRARKINADGAFGNYFEIPAMADKAFMLLRDAMDSFIEEDNEKARDLPKRDKAIDDLNRENFAALNAMILENPAASPSATQLMFVSKSLERIGDHAANIAEEVYYLFSGEDIRHTDVVRRSEASQ